MVDSAASWVWVIPDSAWRRSFRESRNTDSLSWDASPATSIREVVGEVGMPL